MRAKKSYGQHFLTNTVLSEKIAHAMDTEGLDYMLEVGPGQGMLTQYLLECDAELAVVEADSDMVGVLMDRFPALRPNIHQADFLKFDLDPLFDGAPFGLIGNYPYNISSQILFKMVDHRHRIPEMVGMFQKEVADRVIAPPGSKTYGVISVLVQAYYKGSRLFNVSPGNFNPPPKVQSAVIRLQRKADYELPCDEKLFRRIVKQAFLMRRKMLRNTMKAIVGKDPILQEDFFQQRPEQLSVEDFIQVTQRIEKCLSERNHEE